MGEGKSFLESQRLTGICSGLRAFSGDCRLQYSLGDKERIFG